MGAKPGKSAKESDEPSSPKKSSKRSSKRGSKSQTPSRESSPTATAANIPELEREPGPGRNVQTEKSKPQEKPSKTTSPTKGKAKHGKPSSTKSPQKVVTEEITKESPVLETRIEKENVRIEQITPIKKGEPQTDPMTPLSISVTNHQPQATSTPAAPNGVISSGMESPPLSPDDTTDQSDDDEAYTPTDQQFRNRTPSPTSSLTSSSTTSSLRRQRADSGSLGRKSDVNFGRFYNTSYLENGKSSYLKRPSMNPSEKKSPHFHRPPNFSFSKETPEFLKSKKGSGMMALAAGKRVVKVKRESSPANLNNTEAVRLSAFPAGKPAPPNEPEKIERDDWPGPACPAALLPEILRERRRSKGEKDFEDEEEIQQDPKIMRELEEISKLKDKSGIGSVIYRELEERKILPAKALDPWKSSRAPSAKYEPRYRTRFQSPMFASPSRFLDRPRYSWDDSDIRGYRSLSTLANMPVPKPGYGLSYSMTPRAATLPLSGMYGARVDFRYFDFDESGEHGDAEDGDRQRSRHTSSSTLTTDTGSKREARSRGSSTAAYDGPSISLLKLQKSTWHTEAEPPIYPYEKLKITDFNLPKDVDMNKLEIHLSESEFENLFKMPRDKFYRLAEWKRNDMKRKLDLY